MNQIPNSDRARITAILCRVISELAGGDPADDLAVSSVLVEIMELCYLSRKTGDLTQTRAEWIRALDLTTEKDFLFTVRKVRDRFHSEALFGTEMETAKLAKSFQWVRNAGVN